VNAEKERWLCWGIVVGSGFMFAVWMFSLVITR